MSIQSIVNWFEIAELAKNNKGTAVQLGCCIEEIRELFKALYSVREEDFNKADIALSSLESLCKSSAKLDFHSLNQEKKLEMLDAISDIIVTLVGLAYSMNMDIVNALEEVNASNHSKFENGKAIKNNQGKIIKGKNYTKPNLKEFINVERNS